MIERASEELGIDIAASFVIGDKACDVELGRAAGATTILVRTGYGRETEESRRSRPITWSTTCRRGGGASSSASSALARRRRHPGGGLGCSLAPRRRRTRGSAYGVAVAVRDADDRLLLERRADCGLWGLPGGKMTVGETLRGDRACARWRRRPVSSSSSPMSSGIYSVARGTASSPTSTTATWSTTSIRLRRRASSRGSCRSASESLELAYFDLEDLPRGTVPPVWAILEDLRAGRRTSIR